MCPACLAAMLVAGATSGGGLWALEQIARAIGMETPLANPGHRVGTRNEWLAARLTPLEVEKEHAALR